MKLGILLGVGLVVLFAGLANFWFGNLTVGVAMIAVFAALAAIAAAIGKRDYDARPVHPPVMERSLID